MIKRTIVSFVLVLLITGTLSAQDDARIQPEDLTYLGAFRLPEDAAQEDTGWLYAGHAMAYYPDGDPDGPDDGFPGSLFGTGHDWNQYVSEIGIPAPVISPQKNPDDLNMAATLQPFTDIRGDMFGELEMPHAGLAYLPPQSDQESGKLYFAWGQHLEENAFGPSHGWRALNLSAPESAGPWAVAGHQHYETTDYLFPIAPDWAANNLPGMLLATGRFREGGQVSCGPTLFAIAPWQEGSPPHAGVEIPAVTLLKYAIYSAPAERKLDDYADPDSWTGGAWLTAGEKSAVIFVGTKGLGEAWYGFANGVVWEGPPYPDVPDYPYDSRGYWSEDYEAQIIFYDPADLAAVARGEMESWEPQPYARMSIDDMLFGNDDYAVQKPRRVGAAAFDRERGLLYVFEPTAYEGQTLVHVWRIGDHS